MCLAHASIPRILYCFYGRGTRERSARRAIVGADSLIPEYELARVNSDRMFGMSGATGIQDDRNFGLSADTPTSRDVPGKLNFFAESKRVINAQFDYDAFVLPRPRSVFGTRSARSPIIQERKVFGNTWSVGNEARKAKMDVKRRSQNPPRATLSLRSQISRSIGIPRASLLVMPAAARQYLASEL
jgi:hypothetical protein